MGERGYASVQDSFHERWLVIEEADRCTLDGSLVCLYRGESLMAVFPRRMVMRIEEQAGSDIAAGDPLLNWMSVLSKGPTEPPKSQ